MSVAPPHANYNAFGMQIFDTPTSPADNTDLRVSMPAAMPLARDADVLSEDDATFPAFAANRRRQMSLMSGASEPSATSRRASVFPGMEVENESRRASVFPGTDGSTSGSRRASEVLLPQALVHRPSTDSTVDMDALLATLKSTEGADDDADADASNARDGADAQSPTSLSAPANRRPPTKLRNVYVASLPLRFTDAELFALLSPFGSLVSCKMFNDTKRVDAAGRSYGFGLYESQEAAARAVATLSEVVIDGRKIQIRLARNGVVKRAMQRPSTSSMPPAPPQVLQVVQPCVLPQQQPQQQQQQQPLAAFPNVQVGQGSFQQVAMPQPQFQQYPNQQYVQQQPQQQQTPFPQQAHVLQQQYQQMPLQQHAMRMPMPGMPQQQQPSAMTPTYVMMPHQMHMLSQQQPQQQWRQ